MQINPGWVTAGIALIGFVANATWMIVNLRIENKLLLKFDEWQERFDERYVLRPDRQPHVRHKELRHNLVSEV